MQKGGKAKEEKKRSGSSVIRNLAAEKSKFFIPLWKVHFSCERNAHYGLSALSPAVWKTGTASSSCSGTTWTEKCIESNFTKTRKSVGDFVCGIFPPLPVLRCCDIWLFKGLDSAEGHHPRDDQEKNRKRRRNGNDDDDG